jgi:hypothetical protein
MDDPQDATTGVIESTSCEYLGKWNRLISTTNWEKGQIICQWREALQAAGAPSATWTDEAWSHQVGNVSPQHVGRLRRVYQRFGPLREQYPGLYWSHFQGALEWPDPELWLEGAVQSQWSVAQMRQQRCEALGLAADAAGTVEIVAAEYDEDAGPGDDAEEPTTISASTGEVRFPDASEYETSAGDEPHRSPAGQGDYEDVESAPPDEAVPATPAVRPFENLAPLPADLGEAFERFKLAILHHKIARWEEVSCQHVLETLEALKQLALAPTDGG